MGTSPQISRIDTAEYPFWENSSREISNIFSFVRPSAIIILPSFLPISFLSNSLSSYLLSSYSLSSYSLFLPVRLILIRLPLFVVQGKF